MKSLFQRLGFPQKESSPKASSLDSPGGLDAPLTTRMIFKQWFPLALSWTVMSFDGIILAAIMARLPDPKINLAAYGGIAFSLAFVMSAPISSMLAISTALSRNWQAFARLRKFMLMVALAITAVYALIALTPLYYWVAGTVIGAPAEILEPGRWGLIILMPFPFLVGFRRLQQGVLIRFGQADGVTISTFLRIITEVILLLLGMRFLRIPGIMIATGAQTGGMVVEMLYATLRARPVIRNELKAAPVDQELTWRDLLRFFIPFSLSTIISFSFQFINSAGMSRMPMPIESLAIFPVVSSFAWMLQGPGVAHQEVVVSLLDRRKSTGILRRFTISLITGELLLTLLVLLTPLSILWFTGVSSLSPDLARMANLAMWFFLPQSGIAVLQCWYQGLIIYSRRTRLMTEAIVVSLAVEIVIMAAGILTGRFSGIYVASFAFLFAYAAQIFWQYLRSRSYARSLHERDQQEAAVLTSQ